MPHPLLPGPRAWLREGVVQQVADRDPERLQWRGRPNAAAVARELKTTHSTLYKMLERQLPLNLEVFIALAQRLGSWRQAIALVEFLDEDGERVHLALCERDCSCGNGRELVAA